MRSNDGSMEWISHPECWHVEKATQAFVIHEDAPEFVKRSFEQYRKNEREHKQRLATKIQMCKERLFRMKHPSAALENEVEVLLKGWLDDAYTIVMYQSFLFSNGSSALKNYLLETGYQPEKEPETEALVMFHALNDEPFCGFLPQDMAQWLSSHFDEAQLKLAVAIVSKHIEALCHDFDSGDPRIDDACRQWQEIQNDLRAHIRDILEIKERKETPPILATELQDFGIMTEPFSADAPIYNLRQLLAYCKQRNVKPETLTDEERKAFLVSTSKQGEF